MVVGRRHSPQDHRRRTPLGRAQPPAGQPPPHLLRKDLRASRGSAAPLPPDRQLRLAGRQRRLEGRRRSAVATTGEDVSAKSGLQEIFEEISPIEDFSETMSLSFENPVFYDPKYTVDECKEKDFTYSAPLYVSAEFTNNETGEIKGQTVFMGDFPLMTDKGTFIINGTERVVVSQLVRSPGRLLRAHRRQDVRQGHLHRQAHPVAAAPGWSSRSTSATWSASASTASASRTSRCCSRPSAGPTSRSARSSASTSR